MQVDLSSNFFELFGLPLTFELDAAVMQKRYQTLQKAVHPDNFAAASDAEKRWSMQAAATLNDAQSTLSHPLKRASYLLKLNDVDLDVETDTSMSPQFLMQQMELREQMEEISDSADPFKSIDSVRSELKQMTDAIMKLFADSFASQDYAASRDHARQWQFLDKLTREVGEIEAVLDDA